MYVSMILGDLSVSNDPYHHAMRLKGLALQGFVDFCGDTFLVKTTTVNPKSKILVNKSAIMQPANT